MRFFGSGPFEIFRIRAFWAGIGTDDIKSIFVPPFYKVFEANYDSTVLYIEPELELEGFQNPEASEKHTGSTTLILSVIYIKENLC